MPNYTAQLLINQSQQQLLKLRHLPKALGNRSPKQIPAAPVRRAPHPRNKGPDRKRGQCEMRCFMGSFKKSCTPVLHQLLIFALGKSREPQVLQVWE